MQLETFRSTELRQLTTWVKRTLGEDAMILRTRVLIRDGRTVHEVVAASAPDAERFLEALGDQRPVSLRKRGDSLGPWVMALVGPAGAGKTSAAVKLALHPRAFGNRRVGLVTLDTFRAAAVEELQTYAEIAGLPMEVAYHPREVPEIVARLRDVEVILVDTPGRAFEGEANGGGGWLEVLLAFEPDETHLVLPAGLRTEVTTTLRRSFGPVVPTHALFTHLDEIPRGEALVELVESTRLPVRWVADGCDIPGDLATAGRRILSTLSPTEGPARRRVG